MPEINENVALSPDDEVVQRLVKYPDKRWALIQAMPRKEKFSAKNCAAQGIVVYLPLLTKVEIHHRGKRELYLPMFPGYFFACPSREEQTLIRREKGIWNLRLLSECEETVLLRDLLKVRESELLSLHHQLVVNPGLKAGDKVLVKKGPFAGQEVIVLKRANATQIIVNLEFLGQNIELCCGADEVSY